MPKHFATTVVDALARKSRSLSVLSGCPADRQGRGFEWPNGVSLTAAATPLQGRYSFVGAQPSLEVVAKGSDVVITRHPPGNAPADVTKQELTDPLQVAVKLCSCSKPTVRSPGSLA